MRSSIDLRHGASRTYAVITWVIAAVFEVSFLLGGSPGDLLRYGAYPLLLAALGWAVFWQPRVLITSDDVTVVNIARTTVVPMAAIRGISTRLGLRLETPDGPVEAWAAPARAVRRRDEPAEERARRARDRSFVVRGDAETAAAFIRDRIEELGPLAPPTGWRRERRWNIRELAVLAVAAALAGVTALA